MVDLVMTNAQAEVLWNVLDQVNKSDLPQALAGEDRDTLHLLTIQLRNAIDRTTGRI